MDTDELVQISGKPGIARRALYEVSTLLHQNPRKDNPPSGFPMPVPHGGEAPADFSMKILCPASKIGGVIGKGGSNVRELQQETGTNIHVDDVSTDSDERVICVSSFEALSNPRSRTIDAILLLQDKTSDQSEKGTITTRLLIPSNKVGCILGQGGQVINEMRRRTKADICVYSKEEKPKCAGVDEELVQVSGNYVTAKDVIAEIASRYRARCLRDAKPGPEPAPPFSSRGNVPVERPSPRGGRPGGYEPFKGGGREYEPPSYPAPPREYEAYSQSAPPREYEAYSHPAPPREYEARPRDYEPQAYPVPPNATGFPGAADHEKMPSSGRVSAIGPGVGNANEITGTRAKLQDAYGGNSESIRGSSQNLNYGGQKRDMQNSYHDKYAPRPTGINPSYSHTPYHNYQNNPSYYSDNRYQY